MRTRVVLFLTVCVLTLRAQDDDNALIRDVPVKTNAAPAKATPPAKPESKSGVATLATSDLREFDAQPDAVKKLIARALELTTQQLVYKYGSADPKNGGMDCSGTVYFLLNDAGLKDVPRDASEMYTWVWKKSTFRAVVSSSANSFEFAPLKPGDLLFWTGTYKVERDPPVTHVMIYLGINKHTGHRVMVGASEGRRFDSVSRYGVSVFDFELPRPSANGESTSRFIGYGAIPGITPPL